MVVFWAVWVVGAADEEVVGAGDGGVVGASEGEGRACDVGLDGTEGASTEAGGAVSLPHAHKNRAMMMTSRRILAPGGMSPPYYADAAL